MDSAVRGDVQTVALDVTPDFMAERASRTFRRFQRHCPLELLAGGRSQPRRPSKRPTRSLITRIPAWPTVAGQRAPPMSASPASEQDLHRCKRFRVGRLLARLSTCYLPSAAPRGSRVVRIPAHQQNDRSQNGENEQSHPGGRGVPSRRDRGRGSSRGTRRAPRARRQRQWPDCSRRVLPEAGKARSVPAKTRGPRERQSHIPAVRSAARSGPCVRGASRDVRCAGHPEIERCPRRSSP